MILARFHPQAWINDYAVDVDPEGQDVFDITSFVQNLNIQVVDIHETYKYEDLIKNHSSSPEWVKDWQGPYYFSFHQS